MHTTVAILAQGTTHGPMRSRRPFACKRRFDTRWSLSPPSPLSGAGCVGGSGILLPPQFSRALPIVRSPRKSFKVILNKVLLFVIPVPLSSSLASSCTSNFYIGIQTLIRFCPRTHPLLLFLFNAIAVAVGQLTCCCCCCCCC